MLALLTLLTVGARFSLSRAYRDRQLAWCSSIRTGADLPKEIPVLSPAKSLCHRFLFFFANRRPKPAISAPSMN